MFSYISEFFPKRNINHNKSENFRCASMTKFLHIFITFIDNNINTTSDDISKENFKLDGNKIIHNNSSSGNDESQESFVQQFEALNIASNSIVSASPKRKENSKRIWGISKSSTLPISYAESSFNKGTIIQDAHTKTPSNTRGAISKTEGELRKYNPVERNVSNKEFNTETDIMTVSDNSTFGIVISKDNGNKTRKFERALSLEGRPPQKKYFIGEEEKNRRINNPSEIECVPIYNGARPKTGPRKSNFRRPRVSSQRGNQNTYKPVFSTDDRFYTQSHRQNSIEKWRNVHTDINTASNSFLPHEGTSFNNYYSNTRKYLLEDPPIHKYSQYNQRTVTPHSQSSDESYDSKPSIHSNEDKRWQGSSYTHSTYRKSEYVYFDRPDVAKNYTEPDSFLMNKYTQYDSVNHTNDKLYSFSNNIYQNDYFKYKYQDASANTSNPCSSFIVEENQTVNPYTNNEDRIENTIKESQHGYSSHCQSHVDGVSAHDLDRQNIDKSTEFEISHTMVDILENPIYKEIHEKIKFSENSQRISKEIVKLINELKEKIAFNRESLEFRTEKKQETVRNIETIDYILDHVENVRELNNDKNFCNLVINLTERISNVETYISSCKVTERKFSHEVSQTLGNFHLYDNEEFLELVRENRYVINIIIEVCIAEEEEINKCFRKLGMKQVFEFV